MNELRYWLTFVIALFHISPAVSTDTVEEKKPIAQPFLQAEDLILPQEIGLRIFNYLDVSELLNLQLVCKRWYALTRDDLLWGRRLEKYFPLELLKYIPDATAYSVMRGMVTTPLSFITIKPPEGFEHTEENPIITADNKKVLFKLVENNPSRNKKYYTYHTADQSWSPCPELFKTDPYTITDMSADGQSFIGIVEIAKDKQGFFYNGKKPLRLRYKVDGEKVNLLPHKISADGKWIVASFGEKYSIVFSNKFKIKNIFEGKYHHISANGHRLIGETKVFGLRTSFLDNKKGKITVLLNPLNQTATITCISPEGNKMAGSAEEYFIIGPYQGVVWEDREQAQLIGDPSSKTSPQSMSAYGNTVVGFYRSSESMYNATSFIYNKDSGLHCLEEFLINTGILPSDYLKKVAVKSYHGNEARKISWDGTTVIGITPTVFNSEWWMATVPRYEVLVGEGFISSVCLPGRSVIPKEENTLP